VGPEEKHIVTILVRKNHFSTCETVSRAGKEYIRRTKKKNGNNLCRCKKKGKIRGGIGKNGKTRTVDKPVRGGVKSSKTQKPLWVRRELGKRKRKQGCRRTDLRKR